LKGRFIRVIKCAVRIKERNRELGDIAVGKRNG